MRLRIPRVTPALAISVAALFVALGGSAYAATGGTFILGQPNSATRQARSRPRPATPPDST